MMENKVSDLELRSLKEQYKLGKLRQDEEKGGQSSSFDLQRVKIEDEIIRLNSRNRSVMFTKAALVFIVFLINFLHTRNFSTPRKPIECLKDSVFELTESINNRLNNDPSLLKFLQVTSSSVVDFADVSVLLAYNLRGITLAFPAQVFLFYVLRALIQSIFLFRNN